MAKSTNNERARRTCGVVFLIVAGACAGSQASEVRAPYTAVNGLAIIAHRGGALEAPENTIAAVRHAIDVGADWIEVDVVLSRDGYPMVAHEDALERYAHRAGQISEMTRAEIQKIHVGSPTPSERAIEAMSAVNVQPTDFGARYPKATIPTLDEVLQMGGRTMIELKATSKPRRLVDAVLESIKNTFSYERVVIGSMDPTLLDAVAVRDPTLPLVAILEDPQMLDPMLQRDPKILAVRTELAAEALERAPEGTAVWVWTIYSEEMAKKAVTDRVHGLITDVPSVVVTLLRRDPDVYIRRIEAEELLDSP